MANDKLDLLIPTTVFKPQPYGGVRSSVDLNEFMDCTISDIYTLVEVINTKVVPILNGLPLGEIESALTAVTDGLTAASLYVGSDVTSDSSHADYYYRSLPLPERINTVKEVFDKLITDYKTLSATVDGIVDSMATSADPDADIAVLEEEVKDLRNSVVEIVTVLRNLKFYTDWEKLHYNVVLGDPDVAKSPTQTLVNISPAVKFISTDNQNMYGNFAIPRNVDLTEPIICNFTYCVDTNATGFVKVDFDVQNLSAGQNLLTGAVTTTTLTLSPPTSEYVTAQYVGTTFTFTPGTSYNLISFRIGRDVTVAGNHSGNLYILDLSFFGKRLPVNLVTI